MNTLITSGKELKLANRDQKGKMKDQTKNKRKKSKSSVNISDLLLTIYTLSVRFIFLQHLEISDCFMDSQVLNSLVSEKEKKKSTYLTLHKLKWVQLHFAVNFEVRLYQGCNMRSNYLLILPQAAPRLTTPFLFTPWLQLLNLCWFRPVFYIWVSWMLGLRNYDTWTMN